MAKDLDGVNLIELFEKVQPVTTNLSVSRTGKYQDPLVQARFEGFVLGQACASLDVYAPHDIQLVEESLTGDV